MVCTCAEKSEVRKGYWNPKGILGIYVITVNAITVMYFKAVDV